MEIQALLILLLILNSLFCGFILAMATVVQKALESLDYRGYCAAMGGIIASGRKSKTVLVLIFLPILLYIAVPVFAWQELSTLFRILIVGAGVLYLSGALLASRYWAEPLYDRIMALPEAEVTGEWKEFRKRWRRINLVRFLLPGISLVICIIVIFFL